MFRRAILTFAALFAAGSVADAASSAQPAALFSDDACPAATPLGRHLNELNAQASPSPPDLVATARGLVDAYRSCVVSFDRDAHGHGGDSSSDYVVSHRMYARLALARSLQRVGSYSAQLHDPASAKLNYDDALKSLAEVESIGANARGSEGSETKLLQSSRALQDEIVAAQRALSNPGVGAAAGASPSPSASSHP